MKSLLWCSIIVTIAVSGEALRCYQSYSFGDSFDSLKAMKINCSESGNTCAKVSVVLTNGTDIFLRTCLIRPTISYGSGDLQKENSNIKIESQHAYYCDTELCNNSQSISLNFIGRFLVLITVIPLIKILY